MGDVQVENYDAMRYILKLIFMMSTLVVSANAHADEIVTLRISDGIDDNYVKQRMENTISRILTEANAAHAAKRELNYAALNIPESVQGSLAALCKSSVLP